MLGGGWGSEQKNQEKGVGVSRKFERDIPEKTMRIEKLREVRTVKGGGECPRDR